MITYEVKDLSGIWCMYLCNCIPSADYRRDGTRMFVTVPVEDDAQLRDYLTAHEYEFRRLDA